MSLFTFSMAPFCHEQYKSAKYTMTFSLPLIDSPLVISRCAANSHPLSVVIVLSVFLYGNSSLTTAVAVGIGFLPWDTSA